MNQDGFVNETERQAANECAHQMRNARTALRLAGVAAANAGFGSMMLAELEDLLSSVNQFRATYELV